MTACSGSADRAARGGGPLVTIAMAVYEPDLAWLREQLLSLEGQSYPALELIVLDDGSEGLSEGLLRTVVQSCVRSFPAKVYKREQNRGSNATFEELTALASGKYIAYCDQDDVWLPEKIATLVSAAEESGAPLVCSDMYVIDGRGNVVADSITKVRRHHRFLSGEGLTASLFCKNFVTGCTMLVRAEQARAALPFCPFMVHDHWLALFCSARGAIVTLPQPLIRYRIHSRNQTLVLAGVHDKASYTAVRVQKLCDRLAWLQEHFDCPDGARAALDGMRAWAEARLHNMRGEKGWRKAVWQGRRFGFLPSLFEQFAPRLPKPLFSLAVKLVQKNRI